MKKPNPDLEALLEHGRIHRRVPASVRARLLARAREVASAATGSSDPTVETVVPSARPLGSRRWQFGFAATVALVSAAMLASAAVLTYRLSPSDTVIVPKEAAVPPTHPVPPATASRPVDPQPDPAPAPSRPERPVNIRESYAAELKLLNRSQAAFVKGNLSGALALLAEHARRFPRGRLAEEREALRIRSLAGLGQTSAARGAATAFANRFPHSAMLPRVRAWIDATGSGD